MKQNDDRYFQFPLFLFRNFMYDTEKCLNDIVCYGLYDLSNKLNIDLFRMLEHTIYTYYRGGLPNEIKERLTKFAELGEIDFNENYLGFSGQGDFEPTTEMEQLEMIFNTDNDFYLEVCKWFKKVSVINFFEISGNYDAILQKGKIIAESIPDKEPFPMIDKNKLFEFRDEEKTEFQLIVFAANVGMRSILGTKPYCKTTKELILCRAFGFNTMRDLEKEKPPLFKKYFNRYQTDKILNEIEIGNWNLFRYSSQNMRGMFIAYKRRISLEKLVEVVEEKSRKRKIQQLKNSKIIARENAMKKIVESQLNSNEYSNESVTSTTP
ncbi:hypothetical protein TRIP_D440217 [uncultured Paludibacter sp.]|uniref:Uncharacterized protein n=1 Tax=uncultured Paludibacter sp. TaxID=497635 RepID=A0A653AJG3_9BACT|nr:hypothetical protein TRIP_D440217 [uncultured Paludibacter sp.]